MNARKPGQLGWYQKYSYTAGPSVFTFELLTDTLKRKREKGNDGKKEERISFGSYKWKKV